MNQNRSVTSSSTARYDLMCVAGTKEGGEWRRNVFTGMVMLWYWVERWSYRDNRLNDYEVELIFFFKEICL